MFVCPVTTTSSPNFCGFGHCHPFIPPHFWKMLLFTRLFDFFVVVQSRRSSFFQSSANKSVIIAATTTSQGQRCRGKSTGAGTADLASLCRKVITAREPEARPLGWLALKKNHVHLCMSCHYEFQPERLLTCNTQ